jgi:DNA-binding IclR family transcriptional regulator
VLTAFSVDRPEHGLGSLSEELGLSKPTLIRLLECLRFAGFVDLDARSGTYRLGLRAFEVGAVYQQTATLDHVSRPVLARLAQVTGQSTNLAVLDRSQVVHVSVVLSPRPVRYEGYAGLREDAYCTALGKVLLAALAPAELDAYLSQVTPRRRTPNTITKPDVLRPALAEIQRQGYALDDEEVSVGLRCVAAPVRSASGATVAAVSASGPKAEFEGQQLHDLVAAVKGAAGELGSLLGPAIGAVNGRLVSPA